MPRKSSPIWTAPFTIIIDSREQAPYAFDNLPATSKSRDKPIRCETRVAGLPEGDYALAAAPEKYVAIERKSLEDAFGSLSPKGGGRDRFEEEFKRLSEYDFAAVVIEASWPEICNPAKFRTNWHSQLHPRSVFGTAASWRLRYPTVHWIAAGSRRLGEIMTYEILDKANKSLVESMIPREFRRSDLSGCEWIAAADFHEEQGDYHKADMCREIFNRTQQESEESDASVF